jgi:predicted O-methyltransferase YrrM
MQLTVKLQQRKLKRLPQYHVDDDWDERLHGLLGAAWPCPERRRFEDLMADVRALLAAQGLGYGRATYGCYSDSDPSLGGAIWCAVSHLRPEVVIETGVGHGVSSRIILEALQHNERGHLWSIDLPHFFERQLHTQTGAAVTAANRIRWSYLEGSSQQRLPSLIAEVGHVEVFVHDSLHTAKNTMFEMDQAASVLSPGGVMLVDDIATHEGFAKFAMRHPGYRTIVCPSADGIGLFGIAVNTAEAD